MTTEAAPLYAPEHNHTLVCDVPLELISPSPLNPRKTFSADGLAELANSITTHGLLEPIVVRPVEGSSLKKGPYTIIAGERRYHAAKLAGLQTIPARLVEGVDDRKHLELALLENLQRQDLDPLEEAAGYKALQDLGYKQTEIAVAVKRTQPAIAKAIGLLRLPAEVQEMIRQGQLTPTHGVALCRWADFPDVVTHIARAAVRQRANVKWLTDQTLPFSWDLRQAKLVQDVRSGDAHFDTRVCQSACPHAAYVREYDNIGFCLRPDHYAQLQKEGELAERRRVLEAQKAAKAQAAGEEGAAAAAVQELPRVDTLKNVEAFRYEKPPADCTELCPCSAQALSRAGTVIRICTDPKRCASLKAQQTKRENAAKRQADKERKEKLLARLAKIEAVDVHEVALLAGHIITGMGNSRKDLRTVADELVPGLAEAMQKYPSWAHVIPLLAAQDVATLVRLATTMILLADLGQEYNSHQQVTWYLTS